MVESFMNFRKKTKQLLMFLKNNSVEAEEKYDIILFLLRLHFDLHFVFKIIS